MKRIATASLPLLLAACGWANMAPDEDPQHLRIHWRSDFAQATRDAVASARPMLVVMVAGGIQESC